MTDDSGTLAWLPTGHLCTLDSAHCCRDLARAARACREFASYVREQRRSLRTVVVPEGVSYAAVR